jgi:Sec-independent protein translocase protein TatA
LPISVLDTRLVLAVVMVLMFGGNKLPGASCSLGKSLRLFKSELHELHTADKADEPAARPPGSRWGGSTPCGSGSRPQQHRRLTVKRDPVFGSRSKRGADPVPCTGLLAPRRF